MTTYRIIRMYQDPDTPSRAVNGMSGLTLEEAQAHCGDPETSSKTCTGYQGRKRTERRGPWFDGYEED